VPQRRTYDAKRASASMGRSEWGFPLRDQADLDRVRALIVAHNALPPRERGESLRMTAVLRHDGRLYAVLVNDGGRGCTSSFIEAAYAGVAYYPFDKPTWWKSCQSYAWRASTADEQLPESFRVCGG
jgi:hypothetical protein